jgi:hypothetical protein
MMTAVSAASTVNVRATAKLHHQIEETDEQQD